MKCQKIDDKARVWVVRLGPNGKLTGTLDAELVAALCPGLTAEEIADAVAAAAGAAELDATRLW